MSDRLTLTQALEAAGFRYAFDEHGTFGVPSTWEFKHCILLQEGAVFSSSNPLECWAWLRGVLYERERAARWSGQVSEADEIAEILARIDGGE